MYKNMLVPVDGSDLSEVVFSYAKELSGRLNMNLVFLHVCEPGSSEILPMRKAYVEHIVNMSRLHAAETVEVRGEVVTGEPAAEIIKYAETNGIDLILMGTHGHSGIRRFVFGSVTNEVLKSSPIPVWLARGPIPEVVVYDKLPKRKILVPLDGSRPAESVVPCIETLVKQRGVDLVDVVLLGVCDTPSITSDYPETENALSWDEHQKQVTNYVKEGAAARLAKLEKQLADDGFRVHSEVRLGTPADEIIGYEASSPSNLIVMATPKEKGTQAIDNHVVDKVLHGVSSPIFFVKAG